MDREEPDTIGKRRRIRATNVLVFYPIAAVILIQTVSALFPQSIGQLPLEGASRLIWDTSTRDVGRALGYDALSAAGTSFMAAFVFAKLNLVLGVLVAIAVSQKYGISEAAKIRVAVGTRRNVLRFALAIWAFLAIMTYFGGGPFSMTGPYAIFPSNAFGITLLVALQSIPLLGLANTYPKGI